MTEWSALAADPSSQVRATIAGRTDAPPDVLIALASDSTRKVREALVENPACPAEALAKLAYDTDSAICRKAVGHANTTAETHAVVAAAGLPKARRALAQREDIDLATSERLSRDEDWHVREELAWATHHPGILTTLLRDAHPRVRGAVSHNSGATADQRWELADDPRADARAILASAHGNNDDLLFTLARDRSERVRFCLTVHGTNRPLMELLMKDSSEMVANTARNSLRRPPRSDVTSLD